MTLGCRETVMLLLMVNMVMSPSNDPRLDAVELTIFHIIGWQLAKRNSDCPKEEIGMIDVLRSMRSKAVREVIATDLSTILLMMTTCVTNFFNSEYVRAALRVMMIYFTTQKLV